MNHQEISNAMFRNSKSFGQMVGAEFVYFPNPNAHYTALNLMVSQDDWQKIQDKFGILLESGVNIVTFGEYLIAVVNDADAVDCLSTRKFLDTLDEI